MTTTKPRPHADLIKLWADGADIQYLQPSSGKWLDTPEPAWSFDYVYRVKPAREYPATLMTSTQMQHEYDPAAWIAFESMVKIKKVVNAALRHAIDNGQVVPMNEVQEVARNLARQEVKENEALRHLRPVKFP